VNRPKAERLAEFLRRLGRLPAARTGQEAREQLDRTLNAVEDEWTSIPFDPAALDPSMRLAPTERMYPPQDDSRRSVPGRPEVVRFISRGKYTFIRSNGAIEIRSSRGPDGTIAQPAETGDLIFAKAGADGRGVWDA
jgi:hypothetical protein